ncbi:MAG: Gluconolactonase [Frankiales bacterium]|nr:Gluconolactonase [Frankiales bacterium]
MVALGSAVALTLVAGGPARADTGGRGTGPSDGGRVVVDSRTVPGLAYPEGLASFRGRLYVGTYQVAQADSSRVFVVEPETGRVVNVLGGRPGQELIAAAPLLGLAVDPRTGDLFVGANGLGEVLRVHEPTRPDATVQVYAHLPQGAGPEDLVTDASGALWLSDSNLGQVYRIPSAEHVEVVVGPVGSGAQVEDTAGLLSSPVPGLSPNGLAVSPDGRRLLLANTATDSILTVPLTRGRAVGQLRPFTTNPTDAFDVFPYGFETLTGPSTTYGATADRPLNGPDGLRFDADGHLWAADILGGNLTELDGGTGAVLRTVGTSAASGTGSLSGPAGLAFTDGAVYTTNLSIFSDGSNPNPVVPFSVVGFPLHR